MNNEELKIEYIPLDQIKLWEDNPKQHDIEKIWQSIKQNGIQSPAKVDQTLDAVIFGNGRIETIRLMERSGEPVPKGIKVDDEGRWLIPVIRGNDFTDKNQAISYALDDNLVSSFGADITHLEATRVYDQEAYLALLSDPNVLKYSTTADEDDLNLLRRLLNEPEEEEEELPPPKKDEAKGVLIFESKEHCKRLFDHITDMNNNYLLSGELILDIVEEKLGL